MKVLEVWEIDYRRFLEEECAMNDECYYCAGDADFLFAQCGNCWRIIQNLSEVNR